jgi:nicotinate-nucleotide adenylyltransferase
VERVRLGVLGGTFDPVHLGHLVLAQYALEQLALDRVAFLPAGDPWRKAAQAVTSVVHRVEMTRLAIADNPAFYVDDAETRRDGPTYTAETMEVLRRTLAPDTEIFFLLGADALADLPFWHEPERIVAAALLAVAPREGTELALPAWAAGRSVEIAMPYIGISSTEIRDRVRAGLSIRYLVPAPVAAYIAAEGLYRPNE